VVSRVAERPDLPAVRAAAGALVDSPRYDGWLRELPDDLLVALVAPLEMLQFQYYRTPPADRMLVRAARACCRAAAGGLAGCPADLAGALGRLAATVGVTIPKEAP
jgi:hypothetical protein